MTIHRIRLAGPWESQSLDEQLQPVGEISRCQLPFTVPASLHRQGVLLVRGFHRPTGIESATVLRIVLKAVACPALVQMNGEEIVPGVRNGTNTLKQDTAEGEYLFEITRLIQPFNHLSVRFITNSAEALATLETVWLEIQE